MAFDSQTAVETRSLSEKSYLAVWRWHFYAGLYVVPFFLMLAITGLTMMLITQVSGRDGETIGITQGDTALSITQLSEAAVAAVPGTVTEWIGPKAPDLATVIRVKTEAGQRMVAMNQYTGEVISSWDRRAGWYDFADNIHSDLMVGTTGDRLIEISAGLGLVLVLTGLYLWWPRGRDNSVLAPNFRARGRALWKSLHSVVGFWISLVLVTFLISGLAWAGVWGGKFVQAWSSFPAEKWDNVPLSDSIHASMNHGSTNDVPWALEQTPMPASGSDAGLTGIPAETAVNIDSVVILGRLLGMQGRFRVAYPRGDDGVWTINRDSMSSDSDDPFVDRTIHIDQHSGKILADVKYEDYSWMGKAMAVSIPLHMGLMGPLSFVFNLLFCLAVIFVCVSGVVLWIKRRPSRAGSRLSAPPAPVNMPLWKGAALICVVTSIAVPLLGLTLLAVLAFDVLIIGNIPAIKRALS